MEKRTLKAVLTVCGLVALGLIAILSFACKPAPKHTGPREKMTLAYATTTNSILVHIALGKGFFTEQGLEVTAQPYAFGKQTLDAVLEGKADIATPADTPIVFAVMEGRKIAILTTIQAANNASAIVARQDRGITKPADLKGKNIGVTFGTSADFFIEAFLLANSIEKKQVTLINMSPDEMASAFNTGTVDAVSTFNPTWKKLQKGLGAYGIVFFGENIYTQTSCIVGKQEYVNKNPEVVKKFLRALLQAETFALQHEDDALDLVAALINVDKTVLKEVWENSTIRLTLDQGLLVNLEDQSRWVLKNKLSTETTMPNYLDFIYEDGLKAVKPEAIRIIR